MKKTGRDNRPNLKPVIRVELSQKNILIRVALVVGFLTIAIVSLGYGCQSMLAVPPGWQTVEATPQGPTWAGDFVLRYDFGEAAPTAVRRQLSLTYTQAQEQGYRLFAPEVREPNFYNVGYLNGHPNQEVAVEPELYTALETAADLGSRQLFLAPALAEYAALFAAGDDLQAALVDPEQDPDAAAYLQALSRFTAEEGHIRLELTGEGKVRLTVSREYLDFAKEYGIETFLDFGPYLNAFLADYLAERLTEQGFVNGYLASFDGYTRNLDPRGTDYELNLFHREGRDIYQPARLHYRGPMSLVTFRDYPLAEKDLRRYYTYETGRTVSVYLDPATCRSAAATEDLTLYAAGKGCGELALLAAERFTGDSLSPEALTSLAVEGVHSLWFEGRTLRYTDGENPPELVTDKVVYEIKIA